MANIVVFDGECGLCNGFVAWLIRHDKSATFLLAGSAGEVGKLVITRAGLPDDIGDSTIVLWDGTQAFTEFDAVLQIMASLTHPWRWLAAGKVVPQRWRHRAYRTIAARRPRIEADDPSCGVPPPELVTRWRARLATLADVA